MPVQQAVQPVLGCRAMGDQSPPVSNQGAQVAHRVRGHPDLGNDVSRQQPGQGEGVNLVCLDKGGGDQLDAIGMGHHSLCHQRRDQVVYMPGVGGGFDDHRVGGSQVSRDPARKAGEGHPARTKDRLLLGVDGAGDDVVLVHVESDEAVDGLRHARLLSRERVSLNRETRWNVSLWANEHRTHRYELGVMAKMRLLM